MSNSTFRRTAIAAVAVAFASVLAGCGDTDTGGSDTGGATGSGDKVELAHVHGLGVDPADGALYAGSHHGLFRAADGESVTGPVADRVQDFMGFTVAGPGHFLASGHPGPGQDGPSNLGLLESTDGGETWKTRSLSGEADFHSLEYRHDTVYGINAGELLVSTDMENWDARSTPPIADIAVSPDDVDTIVATTEQGPALSTDGGRNFKTLDGAPLLLLVSWADDGTLVGVDPDGVVFVQSAESETFVRGGELPGPPEALHAQDADTIYASAGGALWRSTDGGRSFQPYPAG